jgi:hypothetical protein
MQAIESKASKTTIPLPVLVGETRTMYAWCQADKSELTANGLKWEIVESLPALYNNGETLSVDLKIEKYSLSQYRKDLKIKFLAESKKRTLLSKNIRYALLVAKSVHKLPSYHRRRAYPEIIEDLFNLAALCDHFKNELKATEFDQKLAVSTKSLSLQLQDEAVALSELVFDYKARQKEFLHAYRKLYTSAQILRNCAFEVFPADSPRRLGYRSQYRKRIPEIATIPLSLVGEVAYSRVKSVNKKNKTFHSEPHPYSKCNGDFGRINKLFREKIKPQSVKNYFGAVKIFCGVVKINCGAVKKNSGAVKNFVGAMKK